MTRYLLEENSIALRLGKCSDLVDKFGQIPFSETEDRGQYPALAFAAQSLSIIEATSRLQSSAFVDRVRSALKDPDAMRAIRLEMMVATHFSLRGHRINWPEMEGLGTFDILIPSLGSCGLEVECKSASPDKGRKIHRREALEFHNIISKDLTTATQGLRIGLTVILTMPGRLPTSMPELKQLASLIIHQVVLGQGVTCSDGIDIRVSSFDPQHLGISGEPPNVTINRSKLDQITQTQNREVMVIGSRQGGVVVLVLTSKKDDTLLKSIFNTISDSANTQLTKGRPGMFMVGLNGVRPDSLVELASVDSDPGQPPTALRVAVSKFLSSTERDHVVSVNFLSDGEIFGEQESVLTSGGSAYSFPKTESPFWHPNLAGLFIPRG